MIATNRTARYLCSAALVALGLTAAPAASLAQDDDPNAAITAETARITAETARITARSARDQARVSALGLPSTAGTTEVGENGGAMEATLLSTYAVDSAAARIVEQLQPLGQRKIILMSPTETIDFGLVGSTVAQMDSIHNQLQRARTAPSASAAPLPIAALTAAVGLIRSDSSLSGIDLPGISDRMLTIAVASRLGGRAIFPSALTATLPACVPEAERDPASPPPAAGSCIDLETDGVQWRDMNLAQKFNSLAELRATAARIRAGIPDDTEDEAKKRQAAALDAAITRYDAFNAAATAPNEQGQVPIAQAVRLEMLLADNPAMVRIYLDRAGGSLLKQTNLLTWLGVDPLRISGALVASYVVTDPRDGSIDRAGVLACRTALTSVRSVQQWNWRSSDADPRSACTLYAGTPRPASPGTLATLVTPGTP